MAESHIFTSLVVPITTNGPSLAALQWSEDGQAFLVTRGAVYILTPSTGLNFDPSSVITASFPQSSTKNVQGEPLSWYRNMIELERTPSHHWPFESQEWGAVSLGSLDMSWSSITLSPTNLSKGSCCMMAALNTNLEVSLWGPSKNYLTGEWDKLQDVTQTIKDTETALPTTLQKTLNAQVHCISWSQQVDLGEETRFIDGSLLALGNRAGRVIFMRLSQADLSQTLHLVGSLQVADDWLTQLTWSSWVETKPGCFRVSLACGVSNGGIIIVMVSLSLKSDSQLSETHPQFDFTLVDEGRSCCPSDDRALTALTWIDSKVHAPILVYAKPGIICLQRMSSELPLGWGGICTLTLQLQPVSSSSTPYAAVSGILYNGQHDALLVSLFDGSFHMVHGVSTFPSMDTSYQGLTSEDLTSQVRTIFAVAEGKVSFADANRTTGVLDYDNAGSIGWLHEKTRPDDFSYKHDAKHASMFIVTRLWRDENFILDQLASLLLHVTNLDAAPTHVLRGVLLHLRDKTFVETHRIRIIELLVQPDVLEEITSFSSSNAVPMSRIAFRHAVAGAFFRRRDIRCRRLKLGIALFCSQIRGITSAPFENLVTDLSFGILCFQLRAVLRQLDCFVGQLEDTDRSFLYRWVTYCLVQRSPQLQQEAAALANRAGIPTDSLLESPDVQEQCPACHAVMAMGIESSATCPAGHIWARCSVTSFILATPFVRTCVGCGRKALLPLSQRPSSEADGLSWLPPAANSWLVQELLEAACWCTTCGNRFVRVL